MEHDLRNKEFGRLTAIRAIEGSRPKKWLCQCKCGNYIETSTSNLNAKAVTSCGCGRKLPRQNRRVISSPTEHRILSLFQDGKSVKEISEIVEQSSIRILRVLDRANLKTGRYRVLSLNEHAFDSAENSPLACYFLGLLFADGSVSHQPKSQPILTIGMTQTDDSVIHALRAFLGSSHKIRTLTPSSGFANARPATYFRLRSLLLCNKLAEYGIVPKKSGCEIPPTSMLTNRDWWRGCVDGDGWCTDSCGYPSIGLTGSKETCEKFADFCRQFVQTNANVRKNHSIWKFNLVKHMAKPIINALYGNACLSVPRKLAAAQRIIARPH